MAPKRGTKRAAEEPKEEKRKLVKKQPKADPMLAGVVDAINMCENLPEDCKKMLIACIPNSLSIYSDERHPIQVMIVDMISDVFAQVQAKMQAEIEEEVAKVSSTEASKSALTATVDQKQQVVDAKKGAHDKKKEQLAEISKTMVSKKGILTTAQQAQEKGDAPVNTMKKELEDFQNLLSTTFQELKESEIGKKNVGPVMTMAKKLNLDESLLTALPMSCTKGPASRGQFDTMVLDQFESGLKAKIDSLTASIAEDAPNIATRAAAVAAAQEDLDKVKAEQHEVAGQMSAAQMELNDAEEGLKAAQKGVAEYEPTYAKATAARDKKKEALEHFQTWNVECLTMMKNKVAAAPAAEEPAADAAAEEAAPAAAGEADEPMAAEA